MKQLVYATGSSDKFTYVSKLLADVPVTLVQRAVEIDEIQSEDAEKVAAKKAADAFRLIKEPLFVTDTFWSIPALNGFPGAYMKEVNQWFMAEDFIHLMQGKKDNRIIAKDVITYMDEFQTKQFTIELEGMLAQSPWRETGNSLENVAQFEGKYLGEIKEEGIVLGDEGAKWASFKQFLLTL